MSIRAKLFETKKNATIRYDTVEVESRKRAVCWNKLTISDLELISFEYVWAMWWTATLSRYLNVVKYLHTTLPTNAAHLIFKFSWTPLLGKSSRKSISFKGFWGLFVSSVGSLTRCRMPYCWVQCSERFVWLWLWILACILISMLSPTSLQHNEICILYTHISHTVFTNFLFIPVQTLISARIKCVFWK